MKKNNPLVLIFIILLFLNSCSTVMDGLGGAKQKNSDEFLVKKKEPLVLPPDFEILPEPGASPDEGSSLSKENTLNIEELIRQSSSDNTSSDSSESKSLTERSIIEKIKE